VKAICRQPYVSLPDVFKLQRILQAENCSRLNHEVESSTEILRTLFWGSNEVWRHRSLTGLQYSKKKHHRIIGCIDRYKKLVFLD